MFLKLVHPRAGLIALAVRNIQTVSGNRFQHEIHPAPARMVDKKDASRKSVTAPTLLHSLKMVSSSYELFELISLKRNEFTSDHVMQALKTLFQLQKHEKTAIHVKHILRNPDFENLCRQLKSVARTLNVNEVIEAIKILNFVGVPPDSDICMTMLHLIRTQINDVSLGQIIFLDFLLKRFKSTPLVDALRIALPMLMQIQLAAKMDHENTVQLCELLQFAANNPMSEQCTMNIVSALTMHGTELTADEARSIVWSLCDMPNFSERYEKLMHNCLEVLCDSLTTMSFENMESTVSKMVIRYMQKPKMEAFYHEEFFSRSAKQVLIRNMDLQSAIYLQRKFNKMGFLNTDLVDYITDEFARNPELLSSANQTYLMTFITSMSTPYYKPLAWDGLKEHVLNNPIIRSTKTEYPWLRFILELLVLGIVDHERINLLCDPEFLLLQFKRKHTLDFLLVLLLHQYIEILMPNYTGNRLQTHLVQRAIEIQIETKQYPLKDSVNVVFGGETNVYHQVVSKYGHCIDHIVVFNSQGEPIQRAAADDCLTSPNTRLEDIHLGEGERMVAIVTFPRSHYCINVPRLKGMFELRIRTMEALGISVCPINHSLWEKLPDREKLSFIEREVRQKLI